MQTYHEEHKLIEQLRKGNLRATVQRLAIMRAIKESHNHPSVEDIYNHLKRTHSTLSLATVYKTLQVMADLGVLITIDPGMGGQRYDGNIHPHHHAICTRCGKIYDIDFIKLPISLSTKNVLPGFHVQSIKVIFSGTCHNCETMKSKSVALAAWALE
jgi:Fur family transcriptional regulator, peroxide stress response regulator